jgi:putative ABC transport system permease protein
MQLDPELPLSHVDSQARVIALQMVGLDYITGMLGVSGLISLLLAAVGVYSLMSFTVTERTREVGIRMALGARPGEVVTMLVRQGFKLVGIGLLLGLAGAMSVSQLFANFIYGVKAFDPVSMSVGVTVLSLCAWIACYIPARWASRVDPMEALRHD